MLKETLSEDLKDAMRARDEVRLRTIRSLRAALLDQEISKREGGEATLSEQDELTIVRKQAKQRRDAIEQYEAAGRDDLMQKEAEELRVIESYLPEELSDDEVRSVVHQVIMAKGASSPQDMGRVMGDVMRLLRGKVEGHRVQQLVQTMLSEPSTGQ